ncbi:glutamine--fructose-6-phosphate transaminase (isomerizing) [Sinanaerobacter chloroacetimidivorans]|uniref:Glutamine--fructose-6-phosphate aminotransferase [isomerizing] n=1 Tax=Sinanaerobacter chloroacetimidivorans TaxID=2818044 RepID=A0A8J7W3E0_9FIRM|nr:glutamine--fructose-6-phosphate transaminase (isomerizing) [Sinanaerobacter chloroacetimidivorans]MBR0598190.1 glutamine--fructose-6-phosphate transaminase (isomerizing) [Sinanaerobacter chloroacetimidivorans]
MCGIVGYIGDGNASEIIIDGLKKLEYRGYDSSGIAIFNKGKLEVRKYKGRIANLEAAIAGEHFESKIGIGHTRWATHGAPSDVNAHPHSNMDQSIAIVHNGIIENYVELKEWLIKEHQVAFNSETDTEVIAHLISVFYEGDLVDAVYKAVEKMRGAYGIGVICSKEPDKMVAVRKDSPLVVGLGEGCNFIASDIPALLKHVRKIYLIENNETVVLTENNVKIYNADRKEVKREVFNVTWDADAAEKEGYDHFMLKEIHEQPKGIYETLNRRLDDNGMIKLDGISLTKEELDRFNKVYIVACGTAYHAGLVGKFVIEKLAKIPVEIDVASEFRYRDPFVDDKTLFIAISQSGETLDTLAALREAKNKGARILSIVNVVGSSVARESDDVFYTWAGPEIAVASTKAYTTQLVCLYLIALYMGYTKGVVEDATYHKYIEELKAVPDKLREVLAQEEQIRNIAKELYKREQVFFIGRGLDSGVSYEGSLKLKEISYINSFAIAAGELKHGTIALIEQDTLVIALATQDRLFEKMLSNIQEVKARGAYVIGLAKENNREIEKQSNRVIYIPECMDEITPLLSVVPLQILAYDIAKLRGCDIDKPKNLAKSVTVE